MLFWTHIFDLLAKLAFMALTMAMFLLSVPDPPAKGHPLLFVFCFLAGILIWWFALRPLSSWLHARLRLGARLSWAQARRASMLFSPLRDLLHWHPLWEVRQLPAQARVAAIEEFMDQLQAEQEEKAARLRAAPALSHAFRWLQWVVLAVSVVLTFANLPPASWVSEFQAQIFDGAYHPILTFLIVALPVTGVLRWLEHATGPGKITIVSNPSATEEPHAPLQTAMASAQTVAKEQEKAVDPNDHSRFAPPSR
ncbi:MAG: hypothetical protein NTY98_15180 [Verrucomicrobia bacterium]|nr:hypothetical protein [Verrucomicrobiota bacterium]